MRTHQYPSDLTDEQWPLIEPHLPPVQPGGRPRKTDMRDVVDAVFSILRTGCQWRYLPQNFPPKSTVWRYFDAWRHDGTLDTIHDLLRKKVRTAEKPYHPRTTAAVLVTAADVDDATAAAELFARLGGQPMSHVKTMYADTKYHNFTLYQWVDDNVDWKLDIVRRPKDAKGWVMLPIRWTVERTFAWLGRCRRLSKDRDEHIVVGVVHQSDKASENPRKLGRIEEIDWSFKRPFPMVNACLTEEFFEIVSHFLTPECLIALAARFGFPVSQDTIPDEHTCV
jgi:putative transposase